MERDATTSNVLSLDTKIRFFWSQTRTVHDIETDDLDYEKRDRRRYHRIHGNHFNLKIKYVSLGSDETKSLKTMRILKERCDFESIANDLALSRRLYDSFEFDVASFESHYKHFEHFEMFVANDDKCKKMLVFLWTNYKRASKTEDNRFLASVIEAAFVIAIDEKFFIGNVETMRSIVQLEEILEPDGRFSNSILFPRFLDEFDSLDAMKNATTFQDAKKVAYVLANRYLKKRHLVPYIMTAAKKAMDVFIENAFLPGKKIKDLKLQCGITLGPEWSFLLSEDEMLTKEGNGRDYAKKSAIGAAIISDVIASIESKKEKKTYEFVKIIAFLYVSKKMMTAFASSNNTNISKDDCREGFLLNI